MQEGFYAQCMANRAQHTDVGGTPRPEEQAPRHVDGRRVVVAITATDADVTLIAHASRLAGADGQLIGVHVTTSGSTAGPEHDREASRARLEDAGGIYREVGSDDVAAALLAVADAERASQLVLGATRRTRLDELVRGSVLKKVMDGGPDLDVTIVALPLGALDGRRPRGTRGLSLRRRGLGVLAGAVALVALTAILAALDGVVTLPSVLLLYLVVVVGVSALGGIWAAVLTAVASVLIVNWFFTPPVHTFVIRKGEHWIALVVFVGVGVIVSLLVELAVRRASEAAVARDEARKLARLAGMAPVEDLLDGFVREFQVEGAAILARDTAGNWDRTAARGAPVTASTATTTLPVNDGHLLVAVGPEISRESSRLVTAFLREIATALTINDLRRADEQARELQRATELLTALLSAISHDVRTPLASIKAAVTSLIATDVRWSPSQTAEFLQTIDEDAEQLDAMLGNLLDMSRIRTGALTLTKRRVTLDEVVSAVVAGLDGHPADILIDVDESLPPVIVDSGLLERSLSNLVANAIVASPPGASVRIRGSVEAEAVIVEVIDHGRGIAPADRERAFMPFQQLGDGHSGTTNVGLGLAVAKGFIEAMGGRIDLRDTPGGGLTVVVTLREPSVPSP